MMFMLMLAMMPAIGILLVWVGHALSRDPS
jgi:hypothetical protein